MPRRAPPKRTAPAVTAVDGVDLAALVPIYWAALLKHPMAKPKNRAVPTFAFKRTVAHDFAHGQAFNAKHLIECFFGAGCDKAFAMELVLHELCHLAVPCDTSKLRAEWDRTKNDPTIGINHKAMRLKSIRADIIQKRREEVHGTEYRTVLRDTAVSLFGEACNVSIYVRNDSGRAARCYVLDDLIIKAMRQTMGLPWRQGVFMKDQAPPAAPPVPAKKTRFIEKAMELAELPKGTVVRGQLGGGEWSYIKLAGGWAPVTSCNETPYGSVDFFNLCDCIYLQE